MDAPTATVDITADVNFDFLRQSLATVRKWIQFVIFTYFQKKNCQTDALTFGPDEQGQFLRNLGLDVRIAQLLKNVKSSEEKEKIKSSAEYLSSQVLMLDF